MQRKPFWKLLLLGIGYMALGNVMSTVMTVAAAVVVSVTPILIILFILTLFVFYSLCFTVAYKDGQRERLMIKNHRVEGIIKGRWIKIGLVMFLVMSIPSIILFIGASMGDKSGYLITYRMICGMIYPLALAMGVDYAQVAMLPPYYALIFAACYIFIPVMTELGFDMGFKDKLNADKIMYEKK